MSETDVLTDLGGRMCNCSPEKNHHMPMPLGPAGYCPNCGTEGLFYQQALQHYQVTHNGHNPHKKDESVTAQYKSINWKEVWEDETPEVEWLVEPVLEKGTINALFGKPGTGKSLLALEMCLKVIYSGERVMMIDDENRIADLVERLRAFGAKPEDLDGLITFSFAGLPPLDTPTGGEHLTALADEYKPALVTLDTTSRLVEGEENSANTYLQLYRCSLIPLKGRKITVLRLDHPGKDDTRGQRGSSAKDGDVDTIWRLSCESEDMFTLTREKTRNGHGEAQVKIERQYEPLRHKWTPVGAPVDGKVLYIVSKLDHAPAAPLDITRRDAEQLLRARTPSGTGFSSALVGQAVKYRRQLATGLYG